MAQEPRTERRERIGRPAAGRGEKRPTGGPRDLVDGPISAPLRAESEAIQAALLGWFKSRGGYQARGVHH
jgi:hypothetical protein